MEIKTLVAGLGNPVLGDDSIGIRLVRDLENEQGEKSSLHFSESCQSGLYLMDMLLGYQRVIFVDAVIKPKLPIGKIVSLPLPDEAQGIQGCSPHFIGLQSVISLGRSYGLSMPDEIYVFGIVIHDGTLLSERLSGPMSEKYASILNALKRRIDDITCLPSPYQDVRQQMAPLS